MSVQIGDKFKSVNFSKTGIKKGFVFEVRNIDRDFIDPMFYGVDGMYAIHESWITNGWMVSVGDEE
jgi:hypothetical protein